VTGRIIDADVDALANIDRLTAQVETLKWERDMTVEGQRIAVSTEELQTREVGRLNAQVQRLQESLTAAEQERDDFKRIVEVWRKRHGGAEDRVRVLEGAIERIDFANRQHEDVMRGANGFTRTIRDVVLAALTPAPPAETPAPSDKDEWTGVNLDPVAHKLAIICDRDKEIDRLRAAFAAANEEIARLHASMKLIRDAAKQALDDRDITKAQLGRAVVTFSRYREYGTAWVDAMSETSLTQAKRGAANVHALEAEFDAILADADGTQAAEAWRELEAVYEAAKAYDSTDAGAKELRNLKQALAAVDARRGAVRP
jgi:FtsZ-binding cell division protein ZapB